MRTLEISDINMLPFFKPNNGRAASVNLVINHTIVVKNISLYTSPTAEGGYRLQWPDKILKDGRRVSLVFPLDRETGDEICRIVVRKFNELIDDVIEHEAKTS